jgi:hypothetical protein
MFQVGSGDYDDEVLDEDEAEADEDEAVESETEAVPSIHIVPTMPSPVFPEPTASHPHRHHHGEIEPGPGMSVMPEVVSNVGYRLPTSPVIYGTILPTPVLVSDTFIRCSQNVSVTWNKQTCSDYIILHFSNIYSVLENV